MVTGEGLGKRSLDQIPILLALTLLMLISVACGGRVGFDSPGEDSLTWGSFSNEHGTRDYRLYFPSGYKEQGGIPLIVMLHGCRQDAEGFAVGTRTSDGAEAGRRGALCPAQRGG